MFTIENYKKIILEKILNKKNQELTAEDNKKLDAISKLLSLDDIFILNANNVNKNMLNILRYLEFSEKEINQFCTFSLSPDTISYIYSKTYKCIDPDEEKKSIK